MIRAAAKHPTLAILLLVITVGAGLASFPVLERATFPDRDLSEVRITVEHRSAAPRTVAREICQRLEDALAETAQLAELRCTSIQGRAIATAEITSGGDYQRFLADVRTAVEAIQDLPEAADRPVVEDVGRREFVTAVAIYGGIDPLALDSYAETQRQALLAKDPISRVTTQGLPRRVLAVEPDTEALRSRGLGAAALQRTISAHSQSGPAGELAGPAGTRLLRVADGRRTSEHLADVPVMAGAADTPIQLGALAHIEARHAEPPPRFSIAGQQAVVLRVFAAPNADTLDALDAVRQHVAAARNQAPADVSLAVAEDTASVVRDRLWMVGENAVAALVLVLITVWTVLGLKRSTAVATMLPFALLGTLAVMAVAGLSLNMITLVALLMAVGLMIDTAVVLGEQVTKRRQQGLPTTTALVRGSHDVAAGLTASFLTTVAVFIPLVFLQGEIGQILAALPVVLIVALALSMVAAFLVLPFFLRWALAGLHRERWSAPPAFLTRQLDRLSAVAYPALAAWCQKRPGFLVSVLVALGLGAGALMASGTLKMNALPEIDGDVVEARLRLPPGTPLAQTERTARAVRAGLVAAAEDLQASAETPLLQLVQIQLGVNKDTDATGSHLATVVADLRSADARAVTLDQLYQAWRAEISDVPDIASLNLTEPFLGPQGHALELRLHGAASRDRLHQAARSLRDWLAGFPATDNLVVDLQRGRPAYRISLGPAAASFGITTDDVLAELRASFLGAEADRFQRGGRAHQIRVIRPGADRRRVHDLASLTVTAADGAQVPLAELAKLRPDKSWSAIPRIDGEPTATVTGDVAIDHAMPREIVAALETDFLPELRADYPGIDLTVGGQLAEAAETGRSIALSFLAGLVAVFALLALQFRNFRDAGLALTPIPVALIGVLWGHYLLGFNLAMPSLVGGAALAGIVANNAILLLTVTKDLERAGYPVAQAARLAGQDRFRAVALTTLTTVIGLLPLLAESSLQAQVLKPLIVATLAGLIAAAVMVLVALPSFYTWLHRPRHRSAAARSHA